MKFKKLLLAILAIASCFSLAVSCNDDDEDLGTPSIQIEPSAMSFDSTSAAKTISLTVNRDWKVDSTEAWIAVDPSSGRASGKVQVVTVTVLSNSGYDRTGKVVFGNGFDTKTLTVSQKGPKGEDKTGVASGTGTSADPFNVPAALAKANALTAFSSGDTQTSSNSLAAYVKGKISKIDSVDPTYGNATYYISDGGSDALEVYRGYYLAGAKFTSKDQIKVGDEVVVYGTIVNFKGNTPEITQGSKIVSLNGTTSGGSSDDYSSAASKTVAEFIAAASTSTYYKLKGKVSGFNATYCSFDLTDATGSIYVFSVDNKADWTSKISNGGTVELAGKYAYYETKKQHEVVNANILSFTEGSSEDVTVKTITEIIALADNSSVKTEGALVIAKGTQSFVATDGTSNIIVYGNTSAEAVKIGDKVNISATKTTYGSVPELSSPTVTVASSGASVSYPTAKDITSTFDSYSSTSIEYISFKGTIGVTTSGTKTYYNVTVSGASAKTGSISGPLESLGASGMDGKVATVKGYFAGFSGTGNKYVNIIATSITVDDNAKAFTVSPVTLNVAATATSATFNVSANVAWTATCDNSAFTLDKTSGSESATVTVSFAANTGTAAKTANITVSTTADVTTKRYKVVLTQAAPSTGDDASKFATNVTWTNGTNAYNNGKATVNGVADVIVYKLGTSSAAGKATVSLKKGVSKLSFYGVSWKGAATALDIQVGGTSVKKIDLAANDGATASSPYTITVTSSDFYSFDLSAFGISGGLPSDMDITVTTSGTNNRVILFGIQAQ
jgi:hypothetical protein